MMVTPGRAFRYSCHRRGELEGNVSQLLYQIIIIIIIIAIIIISLIITRLTNNLGQLPIDLHDAPPVHVVG